MGIVTWILDVLFPPCCASCKREGDFLCKNCVQKFLLRPLKKASLHPSAKDFRYLNGVIYTADYHKNPQLQSALQQFKYRFTRELSDYFGSLIAIKLNELTMLKDRNFFLVPVPLHKKRLAYRGFNQSELIANAIAGRFEGRCEIKPFLCRIKNTSQQAKLSKEERERNLSDAFGIKGNLSSLSGRVCFLVDDVCTTGSTLDHCAAVLKKHGVKKVYGLVVARAFR